MTSHQLDEERIFHVARGLSDAGLRSEYLDQVCAGDQALRERVEALLEVHEKEQDFLKSAKNPLASTVEHRTTLESPGTTIGRYKLMEQIGEGGMGTVFVSQQERPIRRKVALKVIKPGMDTKAVVARFEAERQALAMMDHPSIAKVLDAGTTDSGRPYFAMELVKGVPITEYCDRNRLTIAERLELFIQVCQAIQHAHQKGIIHRDIKPSNVLVTLHDGEPVPKVIDFGVAKAINARLTDKTIYTEHLQVVGTLLYMSPEQAELSGLDIDTRSDIYALGVLLYELLTGTTPFGQDELNKAGFDEQRRIIRDKEPPRASVRISSLGETATTVAEHRKTDARKLRDTVRGDLDCVVLKSMEKDRTRRYDSASSFAKDVERYLANDPVDAHPPSISYRFRKHIARNRVTLTVAATVCLALFVGLAVALHQLKQRMVAERKYLSSLQDTIREKLGAGELDEARQLLQVAKDIGLDALSHAVFEGHLLMLRGEYPEAVDLLTPIKRDYPDNIAVETMLAWAKFRLGYEERFFYGMGYLKDATPLEFDDYLHRGWIFAGFFPDLALADLEKARDMKPSSHVALLREAQAWRARAELTPDDAESIQHAHEAIRRLEGLLYVLPKKSKEAALSLLAQTHMDVSCRFEKLGDQDQCDQHRSLAKGIVDNLSGNSIESLYTRAMYHVMVNDSDSLLREYESLPQMELGNWHLACVAIAYLGEGKDIEARTTMSKASEPFRHGAGRCVTAFTMLEDTVTPEILAQYNKWKAADDDDLSSPYRVHDWSVYRLLGAKKQAAEEIYGLIRNEEGAWWQGLSRSMWWVEFAKHVKRGSPESEVSALMKECSQLRIDEVNTQWALAIDSCAEDHRETAIRHLRSGLDVKYIRGCNHWLCQAFLKRMSNDENWPPRRQVRSN